ncbi:hypothetical protein ACHQM5_011534 [Ranunculus cassubicifolius]
MLSKFVVWLFMCLSSSNAIAYGDSSFIYNGFKNANLSRDGLAEITKNGLLQLTNLTLNAVGHAFYSKPFVFKPISNGTANSFSTTFVFVIAPKFPDTGGHGFTFVIAPSSSLPPPGGNQGPTLGLFNHSSDGKPSNHVVAVEFDTTISPDFNDTNGNHVGIDFNSLFSIKSVIPSYNANNSRGGEQNVSLLSGKPMQVWIEYDGVQKHLTVTMAPIHVPKPKIPLLSLRHDISSILLDSMYVGFTAATGNPAQSSHYILGWSFQMNGQAQPLDLSRLPKLPRPKKQSEAVTIALLIALPIFVFIVLSGSFLLVRRIRKYAEIYEDWEKQYGPHRYSYKDLYIATKGFKEKGLLGMGGFGKVYKGVLPGSKTDVAVKRIAHDSKQGITEFIAEIVSIGQLRHRNLVQLMGYCRRKGELFLVYDYMPNGSLDKFLFCPMSSKLNWNQRFQIIKGVASGLVYLHEEWDQVVIHRDIKASNVLLDADFNGKLGDFGLARLYDHGANPQTTHIVGTLGYIAPEMTRDGKATTSTDVYGFGAFLLEVACGRRPIEPLASHGNTVLVDWVISAWNKGRILETADPNLGNLYAKEEMEMVLKLGLLCSHAKPTSRPNMRQIVQFLEKGAPLPELSSHGLNLETVAFGHGEGFDDFAMSYPSLDMTSTSISGSFSGR